MCARWEGGRKRERKEGRTNTRARAHTPALIREQTKDTIIIFIDGGGAPGGEECRCTVYLFRAEYYGHDVIVDFREIACARLRPRDSSFERYPSRPKASLVSLRQLLSRRDTSNSSDIKEKMYVGHFLFAFSNRVAWVDLSQQLLYLHNFKERWYISIYLYKIMKERKSILRGFIF